MRNLKRALSLLLSSTMVLGMVVMGGSAVGYQDVDASNDNKEAIEVLQAVGIMSGIDDAGNFNPDGSVTRNEMAVVMAHLLNLDYDYYRGTNTFSDVPEWAAPYVAACVAEGVTAGIGNGLYGGDQKITAAQAGLMVMKALGYFQNQEDFGEDWQIATIRQASYINLFDKVNSDAESALSRAQVAQLVLNGLKAKMVAFTGDKGVQIGDVTVGYKAEYTPKANAAEKYNTIDDGTTNINADEQYYIQLGEELYNGDLKLQSTTDVFGRPARYWEYDGSEIGTYVKSELMRQEYTTEVTGKDLYDLLGSSTVDTYNNFYVTIDGISDNNINDAVFNKTAINRNNKAGVGETGNGTLTQVFVDINTKSVYISVINTYLAIADADYNDKQDKASLDVYYLDKVNNNGDLVAANGAVTNLDITSEDFALATDVAENDAYLVTVADGEIQTITPADVKSNVTITAFQKGSNLTTDGTKYDYAETAEYDTKVLDNYTVVGDENLKDVTYNVYMDPYGYVIGVDQVTVPNNYVFITGVDSNYSNLSTKNVDASAIFLDGTMKQISINTTKSSSLTSVTGGNNATVNSWFTYSVNSDGVYTVQRVATAISATDDIAQYADRTWNTDIDSKHIALPGYGVSSNPFFRVYGNDNTVYLTASIKEIQTDSSQSDIIIDDVDSVAVGIDNVNIDPWEANGTELTRVEATNAMSSTQQSAGVYTLYDDDGYIIATVVVGEDAGATKNLAYVHSSDVYEESYDSTTQEWTWTRYVTIGGEETLIKEVSDSNISYLENMDKGQWYVVKYNADGEVIDVTADGISGRPDYDNDFDAWTLVYNTDYVNDIKQMPNAILNADGAILYHEAFAGGLPYLTGKTLYTITSNNTGIRVDENVNVVLVQTVDNKETTTFETGVKELENAIADLQKDGNYKYEISAVVENGRATTVVIEDLNKTGNSGSDILAGDWSIENAVTVDPLAGTAYIQNLLDAGKNVYVSDDLSMSQNLVIPQGVTLLVNGDLLSNGNVVGNSGTLKVKGEWKTGKNQTDIRGNVVVCTLTLNNGTNYTIKGEVIVKSETNSDGIVVADNNPTLTIATGAKLYVNEGLGNINIGTGTLTNNGHMEWVGTITAQNANDFSKNSMVGGSLNLSGTFTSNSGNVNVKTLAASAVVVENNGTLTVQALKADTVDVKTGGDVIVTSSISNKADNGDAKITVTGSGSTLDASKAASVDASIVAKDGGVVNSSDNESMVATYDVTAALRGEGPSKAGTSFTFDYGKAYADTGLTFANNTLTVDSAKLAAFDTKTTDDAYGDTETSSDNTALYHLYQESSAGGNRLYTGVAFAAPKALEDTATYVKVEVNGKVIGTFNLNQESVSGTGSDVFQNAYVQYLSYATYTDSQGTVTLGTVADSQYNFFFTWMDGEDGNILGTSACTINLVTK